MAGGKIWTSEEYEYLLEHYDHCSIEEIAKAINRTPNSVRNKAYFSGIQKRKQYTTEEEEFIEEHIGSYSVKYIAKALGRDTRSVKNKINQMSLGGVRENIDGFLFSEVGRMLGKQCCSICYWADKKGLISRRNGGFRVVKEKNLIKFLQEHPDSWDATKVTVKWMWEGQDWFDQKREADFQKMIKARWGEDAV